LATGAKAAAEATVAMRQKAVFIVKSIIVIVEKGRIGRGGYYARNAGAGRVQLRESKVNTTGEAQQ
jgi:hypothetical protein